MVVDGVKIMIIQAQDIIKHLCFEYNIDTKEICKGCQITLVSATKLLSSNIKLFTGKTCLDVIELIRGFLKLSISDKNVREPKKALKKILKALEVVYF